MKQAAIMPPPSLPAPDAVPASSALPFAVPETLPSLREADLHAPALPDAETIRRAWETGLAALPPKIIVLDDDPTGTQTVARVPVYTTFDGDSMRELWADLSPVCYISTNSRALDEAAARALHRGVARSLKMLAKGRDFLCVSRSDSTLRGHYPLEPLILDECLGPFDGHVLLPFFAEGGRLTWRGVHYVRDGESLVPCAQTETARDRTFGFSQSDLRLWVEEKSSGAWRAGDVVYISLEELRGDWRGVARRLESVENFAPVVVDALEEADLKLFCGALGLAWSRGKRFLCRSAASWVRVLAGQEAQSLLGAAQLRPLGGGRGLVVCGSHVPRTSRQLEALRAVPELGWIEWRAPEAQSSYRAAFEAARCAEAIGAAWESGADAVLFSSRDYFAPPSGTELEFASRLASGLSATLPLLNAQPAWIVAKGGITSYDIATRGLSMRCAEVVGQIAAGVSVWRGRAGARWAGVPYIVFPGNVGADDTLCGVVETLRQAQKEEQKS